MNLKFVVNRIKRMSIPEILYRAWNVFKGLVEKFYYMDHPVKAGELGSCSYSLSIPSGLSEVMEKKARDIMDNRVQIFNVEYQLGSSGWDFHKDPETGKHSPHLVWGKGIDYRNPEIVGNIKCLWELNRFTFLFPLVYHFRNTGETRYLAKIKDLIFGWIEQNPFLKGIHWCSSLESALRIINWTIALNVIKELLSSEELSLVKNSIYQHIWFIRRNLSLFSSANNHLIGELAGIYIGCTVFQGDNRSEKWKKFAYRSLTQELDLQFFSDGINREQAFYYQHTVLDIYLLVMTFAVQSGDSIAPFTDKVVQGLDALHDLSYDGKNVPKVGDEDGAVTVDMGQVESGVYSSLFNTLHRLRNVRDTEPEDGSDLKTGFYIANIGFVHIKDLQGVKSFFPDAGYCVLRDSKQKTYLLFDSGPLGYQSIAAHGHSDANSIFLAVENIPVFIDPGTYAYHDLPEWRNYFRSTRAHNTLSLNGMEQSEITGTFMWGRKAGTTIRPIDSTGVIGCHNGFSRANKKVLHEREIHLKESDVIEYELLDIISGNDTNNVELFFHLNPGLHDYCISENQVVIKLNNMKLMLEFESWMQCSVVEGSCEPIDGWCSESFYSKEPCPTIVLSGIADNEQSIRTRIMIASV